MGVTGRPRGGAKEIVVAVSDLSGVPGAQGRVRPHRLFLSPRMAQNVKEPCAGLWASDGHAGAGRGVGGGGASEEMEVSP